ncbi:MAG: protein translocase subunit SecD [Vicinamibacterales bacterium]
MRSSLRWKLVAVLLVLAIFGSLGVYPLLAARFAWPLPPSLASRQLKLGLDLRGGVQLSLRVDSDRVVQRETQAEADRVVAALQARGETGARADVRSPTSFVVTGATTGRPAAVDDGRAPSAARFGVATTAEGTVFTMTPAAETAIRREAFDDTRLALERRIDELGVGELGLSELGRSADRLVVELPGIFDLERANRLIKSAGVLEVSLVAAGPAPTAEALSIPAGRSDLVVVEGTASSVGPPEGARAPRPGPSSPPVFYLLQRDPAITGADVRSARTGRDSMGRNAVIFTLSAAGADRFAEFTGRNIGRPLAVVLDHRVRSVATIDSVIRQEGQIAGRFTPQEASDLAVILRAGSLSTDLTTMDQQTIGATLGDDSIRAGVVASIAGLALVVAFMLACYRTWGVNAVVALSINLVILLGLMAETGVVMTLPGIAGLVLTIGMGVDSNVLVFERMREELATARSTRTAVDTSFSRVLLTLIDTHVAALISAACLYQIGSGPVRGFAVTLAIGLVVNLFTSTFVSRTLFALTAGRRVPARATR